MIVNDLGFVRIAVLPAKADPPLIVDSDTVLSGAIACELLQAVAGRDTKVTERLGRVQGHELPQHDAAEISWISADRLPVKEASGIPVSEALDHPPNVTRRVSNGKR